MAQAVSNEKNVTIPPIPYDLIFFGVLMVASGMMDIFIIFKNPDYRLPVFGMKLEGPNGWYLNLVFPGFHFFIGYGLIFARKWAHRLFVGFTIYGILSASVNFLRLPPPHNIRTIFIIISLVVLVYLYMRRAHFNR